jgi:hypothetical protein
MSKGVNNFTPILAGIIYFGIEQTPKYTVNSLNNTISVVVPPQAIGSTNSAVNIGLSSYAGSAIYINSFIYNNAPPTVTTSTFTVTSVTSNLVNNNIQFTVQGTNLTTVTNIAFVPIFMSNSQFTNINVPYGNFITITDTTVVFISPVPENVGNTSIIATSSNVNTTLYYTFPYPTSSPSSTTPPIITNITTSLVNNIIQFNIQGTNLNTVTNILFTPIPSNPQIPPLNVTYFTTVSSNSVSLPNPFQSIIANVDITLTTTLGTTNYTYTFPSPQQTPPILNNVSSFTTIPSLLQQNIAGSLTYNNPLLIASDEYVLTDSYINYLSKPAYINPDNSSITFNDLIISSGGLHSIYVYDLTLNKVIDVLQLEIQVICFKEGTKILCLVNKSEKYIPIEQITKGTFVKIYDKKSNSTNPTYKKVDKIVKNSIVNSHKSTIHKLYKLSKNKNNRLIEDLYITGSHAILCNKLTQTQEEKMNKLIKFYNNYEIKIENKELMTEEQIEQFKNIVKYYNDYQPKIQDKYKLIAYYDDNFEPVDDNEIHNIYHIVLESSNKSDIFAIYANGILAESTSELSLYRIKSFEEHITKQQNLHKTLTHKYK